MGASVKRKLGVNSLKCISLRKRGMGILKIALELGVCRKRVWQILDRHRRKGGIV